MSTQSEMEAERSQDRQRMRQHMEKIEFHLDETRRQAEYNSAKSRKNREEQDKLLKNLVLFGLAAIAFMYCVLFLLSPGLLPVIYWYKNKDSDISSAQYWIYSAIGSCIILVLTYAASRSKKATGLIYLALCIGCTWIALKMNVNNRSAAEFAVDKMVVSILVDKISRSTKNSKESVDASDKNLIVNEDRAEVRSNNVSASIDCYKASIPIERIICSDQQVADLDTELRRIYNERMHAAEDKEKIKADQINWINSIAKPCAEKGCVISAIEQRINELRSDGQ